jgi:predicted nucleic acid-binding protein
MIAMTDRIFIDSNVWLYAFTHEDDKKGRIVERFISNNGPVNAFVVSYQVINEVCNVLKRKSYLESEIRDTINYLSEICIIQGFSKELALHASKLREESGFSFWDSHIVASAIAAQCNVLASEDMHDG